MYLIYGVFGDREGALRLIHQPCSCGGWGRWHDVGGMTPMCCIKQTADVLHSIGAILDAHSIPYTLDGGTLVGARRCGSMIPWDYDGDLTIYTTASAAANAYRDWVASYSRGPLVTGSWGTRKVGSLSVGDVHIDISNKGPAPPPLERCTFHKQSMSCLTNSSEYLRSRYGDDWRTPKRWCDWSKGKLCNAIRAKDVANMCQAISV